MDILQLILGVLGGVGGSFLGPGGAVAGFSAGAGLGGLLGGVDNSSDPGKSNDQAMLRKKAMEIMNGNSNQSIALQGAQGMNNLSAQLATRGLGNSGVAGSAYGGLYSGLLQAQSQDQLQRAQIGTGLLGGIGATPASQGAQSGQMIANSLPLLLKLLGGK
jgi:hypothetical protein